MVWFKIEKALKLLVEYFPIEDQKKPALFHSIRVCTYLYNEWYDEDICVAWLLHDALEDTSMSEELIKDNFWENVLEIVKANSKNMSLAKEDRLEDIVKRCSNYWEDALIVKLADVYDNFLFYKRENNSKEIDRCKYLAELIKKYRESQWIDEIFALIEEIIEYKV